mgnify:CR=1 FL=1
MTFVNASLLAGTALVVLPIVLHLVMRRKPRLIEFPALRFVHKRHQSNRRRLRLQHLLLLALRVGAIALLALALARPSIRLSGALGSQEAPVAAVLAFDTSMRMQYRHQNRTRLEAAQEIGLWLLAQLPQESQVAVLDSRLVSGAFQADRGAAKHRIERLETVANSQPMTAVVAEGLRLLAQSELARKEIYVFSDMAQVAWPAHAAPMQERASAVPGAGVYVIDVGTGEHVNYALGDLRLSSQVISQRSPLRIETTLTHRGPGGQRTMELYLLDRNRQPLKRNEKSVKVESGQSEPIEFGVEGLALGTHQGYVQIAGEDSLACDDRRYFTVEVRPAWRVLIAAPSPADTHALFLSQALAPTEFRRAGRARFDCEVIPLEKLGEHRLEGYAAVFVLDPAPLGPAVWKKLADFASDGQGVGLFLGRRAESIDSFNELAAQTLLPGKLLIQARRPDGDLALSPRDYQHPILSPLRSQAGLIPWDDFPVFRYWHLDSLAPGVHVVVPFTDGRPAILERPLGRGRVLTMTTPISDLPSQEPWNLLPVGDPGPFVILANQMASYLVGASDEQLNYFAGQTAVLALRPNQPFRSYLLTGPDNTELRLTPDARQNVLVVTSTDRPGNYRVQAGGAGGVDRGFSVNLAAAQTQLDRITDEQLVKLFGQLPCRIARSREQIDRDVSAGRVGRELFPLLIGMVVVVLALEHVVANRFYRP